MVIYGGPFLPFLSERAFFAPGAWYPRRVVGGLRSQRTGGRHNMIGSFPGREENDKRTKEEEEKEEKRGEVEEKGR